MLPHRTPHPHCYRQHIRTLHVLPVCLHFLVPPLPEHKLVLLIVLLRLHALHHRPESPHASTSLCGVFTVPFSSALVLLSIALAEPRRGSMQLLQPRPTILPPTSMVCLLILPCSLQPPPRQLY